MDQLTIDKTKILCWTSWCKMMIVRKILICLMSSILKWKRTSLNLSHHTVSNKVSIWQWETKTPQKKKEKAPAISQRSITMLISLKGSSSYKLKHRVKMEPKSTNFLKTLSNSFLKKTNSKNSKKLFISHLLLKVTNLKRLRSFIKWRFHNLTFRN